MTFGDWSSISLLAAMIVVLLLGPLAKQKIEKRGATEVPAFYSMLERTTIPTAFGVSLIFLGTFTADARDLRSLLVGLGASILGGGIVASTSI